MSIEKELENLKARNEIMIMALDDIQNVPAYRFQQAAFIARMAITSNTILKRELK